MEHGKTRTDRKTAINFELVHDEMQSVPIFMQDGSTWQDIWGIEKEKEAISVFF